MSSRHFFVELFTKHCGIDDKGRAVKGLGGTEYISFKTMGNHDVVADFD